MAEDSTSAGTGGTGGAPVAGTKPAPAPAPVSEKSNAKAGDVAMAGPNGEPLGFSVSIKPGGSADEDLAGLASRVTGWSDFQVDGQSFPYTQENARVLVGRFPHFAEQLRSAN